MVINKIIVHELRKEAGSRDVQILTSNTLISVDDDSTGLITALLHSYRNDNLLNAQFDFSPGKYFPERFTEYRNSARSNQQFIDFSIEAVGNLETIIRGKQAAKGGYLVFCEYGLNSANYTAIFLIRDVEGKVLERTSSSFSIGRIEYLDTNHLAMACRINENLIGTEQNYLTFTRWRQQEVSDYFTDWICVQQMQSSSEFTNALYQIINGIPLPENPDTGQPYSISEIRSKVYDMATDNPRREVNISAISEQIYGNRNAIRYYAEENDINIDTEFGYDKRVLRKFIQLNINKDGIKLNFSRGDLGTKVWASEDDPNQVIIESATLAAALRAEQNG